MKIKSGGYSSLLILCSLMMFFTSSVLKPTAIAIVSIGLFTDNKFLMTLIVFSSEPCS